MNLAFITTNEYVFVTSEENALSYARELKSFGHEIETIEIAPLGSGIRKRTQVESYGRRVRELDLQTL